MLNANNLVTMRNQTHNIFFPNKKLKIIHAISNTK